MARGGFPGMGGMNMNNLVKQAQKMQKQMAAMQEELNEKTLEMTSGRRCCESGYLRQKRNQRTENQP